MVIAGVVAEYNPFHLGHAHHLEETRRRGATHIVAVMSGQFVQRGEPALLDKWTRARAALSCGADLVLELPLPYAMATAQRFALGAVGLLDALGCVDLLSFGSDCGDLDRLKACIRLLNAPRFPQALGQFLDRGMTFAAARQQAVRELGGAELAATLGRANDILALEYLAALEQLGSAMAPLAIPRRGAGHDADRPQGGFASASCLRQMILEGQEEWQTLVPSRALPLYREAMGRGMGPARLKALERPILAAVRTLTREGVQQLPDLSEGLENRLLKARGAASLEELLGEIKTKRYPLARVRRLVLSAFLQVRGDLALARPPYLRVLGANRRGFEVLSRAKDTAQLPLDHSLARLSRRVPEAQVYLQTEALAGDLWALALPKVGPAGLEYTHPPVFLREEDGGPQ